MISTIRNHYPPAALFDISELKAETLSRSQSPLEHQQNHGFVAPEAQ
jgi:hypothetical protein